MKEGMATVNRSFRSFFSGTALSRLTGLGREVMMAAAFGTLPAVAAFWMAFRFAHLLRRLFGEGALHTAFIPHFEQLRAQDSGRAACFFYDLTVGVTTVLVVIVLCAEIALGAALIWGHPTPHTREVIELTMIMLPALLFISLYALNHAFLNCQKIYFLPSVAPAMLNLVWIGALLFVWHLEPMRAMQILSMIVVFAFALQYALTVPVTLSLLPRRSLRQGGGMREIIAIVRPFLLGMLGVAAMQINSLLDALFARAASLSGPATLWYALRLQQLPLALFGVGMAGALLPPISRAIQGGDAQGAQELLRHALKKSLFFLIPITGAIFALGLSSVNLVYGRGAFSERDTYETTYALFAYGLAIIPMTLVMMMAATLYAQKNYLVPTMISLGSVVLNSGLNATFVYGFQMGPISIALATSLASCANMLCLMRFMPRGVFRDLGVWRGVLMTVIPLLATYYVSQWLPVLPRDFGGQLALFSIQCGTFGVLYALTYLFIRKSLSVISLETKASE